MRTNEEAGYRQRPLLEFGCGPAIDQFLNVSRALSSLLIHEDLNYTEIVREESGMIEARHGSETITNRITCDFMTDDVLPDINLSKSGR